MSRPIQRIPLPGRRELAFSEFGDRNGTPLIAFHGVPDSRLIFSMMDQEATELGIRLIAFDRPGFGESDFVANRSPLDTAQDVAELAIALHLDSFPVFGLSGGAVHALATAHELGPQITRVTTLSGWCVPAPQATKGMSPLLRINLSVAQNSPRVAKLSAEFAVLLAQRSERFALHGLAATSPARDRAARKEPAIAAATRENLSGQFRSGDAVADGISQQLAPWPFELDQIKQPVVVWQGGKDEVSTPAMGRHLADQLPNAVLRFERDRASFDFHPLFREILSSAIGKVVA